LKFGSETLSSSEVQRLKVSMSLAAQIPSWYHPVCAMLQPQFPTCWTASSSSCSAVLVMLSNPSDEAERR